MEKSQSPKNKQIALVLAMSFVFGAASLFTPNQALAAKAKNEEPIGYVNRQQVIASYPGIQDIMNRIQTLRDEAQKDYNTNAKDLPPTDKKAYSDKLAQQEARRENELMKPVVEKLAASIKAIAEEKGLAVILEAAAVIYGRNDITADVMAKVKQ